MPMRTHKLLTAGLLPICLAAAGCGQTPQNGGTQSGTTPGGDNAAAKTADANASARPAEAARAYVRAVHVVPGAGPVSLRVNDAVVISGVTYGNASGFAALQDGRLRIFAVGADGKNLAGPTPVDLDKGEDATVVVNGVPGDVALLPFKHKNRGPLAGRCKVAFLHAAKALPGVDVLIDGARFRRDVEYGVATDYKTLPPGRHTMQVTYEKSFPGAAPQVKVVPAPGATAEDVANVEDVVNAASAVRVPAPKGRVTLTQQLDLVAGKVYSVVVFHDGTRLPKLRPLEDKFAPALSRAPVAGVAR